MKKVILALMISVVSFSAFAESENQRAAKKMTAVLQSKDVQILLAQTDTMGSLNSIQYTVSGRATFGPDHYELSFRSNSGPVTSVCKVGVSLNSLNLQVMDVGQAVCEK